MEHIEWQLNRFREAPGRPAIIWRDREYTYGELEECYRDWLDRLRAAGVQAGHSVAVLSDFSPGAVSCLLALLKLRCVLVPLSPEARDQHREFFAIAELDHRVEIGEDDRGDVIRMRNRRGHPLLQQLRAADKAGLVLFSSGSTGQPKAVLHSLPELLNKFRKPRHCYRTLVFLLFDHIGGFNTLFYTLANLGCVVVAEDRGVASVCAVIEKHRVELLPISPSFLNLLLLSGAIDSYDLSSLALITYGTEVMPERTLKMANKAFPGVRFLQTYGLSELGILRSKSESDHSLRMKIGGEDYETRVVEERLFIRARSSMLGYLNAPSPFDDEGWFDTGDSVVQEGDYLRILGRESDIVNVGGQKVYPAEVEQVIAEMDGVIDVAVKGEAHLLLGQVVTATVQMADPIQAVRMRKRIAAHCKGRLQKFMVPVKVSVVAEGQVNHRFKKIRR
ncbi:MAG: long-chain fatty acid--CoA ligase [Gemmatimonadota bacterium]|nr:long-chain fatty acid--CoA ligase [Gemmatimonadota bacterium]